MYPDTKNGYEYDHRVNKTATEARQAAFAARSQTDPKRYGDLVGKTIDGRINDNPIRMARMIPDLGHQTQSTEKVLAKAQEEQMGNPSPGA